MTLVVNLEDHKKYVINQYYIDASERELGILMYLKELGHHENIIGIHSQFVQNDQTYIVFEYEEGESLDYLIQRHKNGKKFFEKDFIDNFIIQMTNTLKYLHSNDVILMDLEPRHIFVTKKGSFQIFDFMMASLLSEKAEKKFLPDENVSVLVTEYLAPEFFISKDYLTPSLDIWAFGVILLELLILEPMVNKQKKWVNLISKRN